MFELKVKYLRNVNWSLLRAGVPFVWTLQVTNTGAVPADCSLRLHIPDFLDTGPIQLGHIGPGARYDFSGREISKSTRVDWFSAVQLTNQVESRLHVEVGNYQAEMPMILLARDEWHPGIAESLDLDSTLEVADAEFSLPPGGLILPKNGHGVWDDTPPLQLAIAALIAADGFHTVTLLKNQTIGNLGIKYNLPRASYFDLKSRLTDWTEVVASAHIALDQMIPNLYHDNPKTSFQTRSQRIRLPDEILPAAAQNLSGATCADLVVLMAAVLEALEIAPLFIVCGSSEGAHALLGWWKQSCLDHRSLFQAQDLQKYRHDLKIGCPTEFVKTRSWDRAISKANEYLAPPFRVAYAVNLAPLRNPS